MNTTPQTDAEPATMLRRLARAFTRAVPAYTDHWGAVTALTLLSLVLRPPRGTVWPALVVGAIGLVLLPWIRRDWRFWALLTAVAAFGPLRHPLVDLDNHHVLELYWLATVTLACLARDPAWTLRRAARLLIGLAFTFAVLWKLLSPDFLDGSFLGYLVIADGNVSEVATSLGLQDGDVYTDNRSLVAEVQHDPAADPEAVTLDPGAAGSLATPLTVTGFALEVLIAVSFLSPLRPRWRWIRDASLVAFVLVTYPAVPVVAFAWLLATMGLAQSELPARAATVGYLAVFLVMGSLIAVNVPLRIAGWLLG